VPIAIPLAAPASGNAIAEALPVAVPAEEPTEAWGIDTSAFSAVHAGADLAPRKRESNPTDRTRTRLLFLLGGLLHLTGVGLVIAWALGAFKSPPQEEPPPPTQKKEELQRTPKKHRQNPPD
ncbi:MAG TPA: hypothetical protein VLM40_02290, partial [Gemmata sp.]|nr:hypothetical protein [Gemmata sp.]